MLAALGAGCVALRKESVDRNAERAVEIKRDHFVALRKESVDRNYKERPGQKARPKSLSARRAWIEILIILYAFIGVLVALRKESVDRNSPGTNTILSTTGRSPQGERG